MYWSSSFALISSSQATSGENWEKEELEEGEMQIITPSKTQIALITSRTPNQGTTSKSLLPKFVFNPHSPQSFLRVPPRCSSTTTAVRFGTTVQQKEKEEEEEEDGMDGVLVVRRPLKGQILDDEGEDEGKKDEILGSSGRGELKKDGILERSLIVEDTVGGLEEVAGLDKELSGFAKKLPMFEPLERVAGMKSVQKPLEVNLELWLYRAKVLGRKFMFAEAEKLLRKCIFFWPENGRAYVALGKNLSKQSKYSEARIVYETGCQATQGENPFIWQCWAVLENKIGNVRRARELFDAATVADEKHVAAWHGWAVLEIKQGNITKARNLLGKGLKCCGGNEYIFQTLAMLEVKANRIEQARYLFQRATSCNPKSCASWLAWAQLEMQQENSQLARKLFEKALQASPKNRFAWHVWALFETNQGDTDKGRKLLKIGHKLNPRDPVLLQSLALLEYKHTSANLARVLFRKASKIDPRHQPIWMAWGWMEWKEGNISSAKELYQKAVSIDSTSETAARCLQAWGVLEQRLGNLSAARRLFRSSLNINSQSYITWMTWASFEEEQGNAVRAEEIRNLYFQQRTEVVDNASWIMGFLDIIDPAVVSIKRLLSIDQKSESEVQETTRRTEELGNVSISESANAFSEFNEGDVERTEIVDGEHSSIEESEDKLLLPASDFDLDSFVRDKLSLDISQLDVLGEISSFKKNISSKKIWKSQSKTDPAQA